MKGSGVSGDQETAARRCSTPALFQAAAKQDAHDRDCCAATQEQGNGESPTCCIQQLGDIMTKAATVVRRQRVNSRRSRTQTVCGTGTIAPNAVAVCPTPDSWTNQNVVFTKALVRTCFPWPRSILLGALQRDECRGAHFKPEFEMPAIGDRKRRPEQKRDRRSQAVEWCDRFVENNQKWLKSTIAEFWDDRRRPATEL